MEQAADAPRRVQSVHRAFELLEHVAAAESGARLSDLADSVGINRSTAHNLLATLETLGYVCQAAKGGRYVLTNRLERFAFRTLEADRLLRERMRPVLEEVARQTGETAYLGFPADTDFLCPDAVESREPLRLIVELNRRLPLLGTAIGHALLAFREDLVERVRRKDPLTWARNADLVADTAKAGYALDLGRHDRGISCVAIPVRDIGSVRAAIGVAGPTSRLPEPRLLEIAEQARALVIAS